MSTTASTPNLVLPNAAMPGATTVAINNFATPDSSSSIPSPKSPSTPQAHPPEYNVLFVGSHHKQPLFERLLCVAEKYERHIQYHDTCYLYFHYSGQGPTVIEMNDPGIEHTGAREMAIRKAHAVIMCYAAYSATSFHQLTSIVDDFKSRKNGDYPPVMLICNEDELIIEEERKCDELLAAGALSTTTPGNPVPADLIPGNFPAVEEAVCPLPPLATMSNSGHQSSTSEGYESQQDPDDDDDGNDGESSNTARLHNSPTTGPPSVGSLHRRPSMENIRKSNEELLCPISKDQGESLAKLFGPNCEFHSIRYSDYSYEDASRLMETLITRIKTQLPEAGKGAESERRSRKEKEKGGKIRSPIAESTLIKSIRRRGSITLPLRFLRKGSNGNNKRDTSSPAIEAESEGGETIEPTQNSATSAKRSMKSVKSKSKSSMSGGDCDGGMGKRKDSTPTSISSASSESPKEGPAKRGLRRLSTQLGTVLNMRRSRSVNPKSGKEGEEVNSPGVELPPLSYPLAHSQSGNTNQQSAITTTSHVEELSLPVGGRKALPIDENCGCRKVKGERSPKSRKHSFRVACRRANGTMTSTQAQSNVCVIS